MLEKIKQYQSHPWIEQFKDIRVLGFVVFGVIVLLVSYSGAKVIQTNYDLEKQVAKLEQEIQVADLQNNNQKLQNEYYKSDQFLELMARKQYNKGLPGETLILVPKRVALANSVDLGKPETKQSKIAQKPAYQRNLEAWRDFFGHKPIIVE